MTQKIRLCSRMTCQREATCTLTYAYADSTVVIGPLATRVEPHAYDMCAFHADRLTVPRGWEVVRLDEESEDAAPGEPVHEATHHAGARRPEEPRYSDEPRHPEEHPDDSPSDSGGPPLRGLPRPE